MRDYHDPAEEGMVAALDLTAENMRERHRMQRLPTLEELAAEDQRARAEYGRLQRAIAAVFGIRGWAAKVADFLEDSRRRRAITLHLSNEAARHSHAPAGKTVAQTMAVYARQMHLRLIWSQDELTAASPGALMTVVRGGFPAFTGPQRRRLTKRINRMKGHTA